MGYIIHMEPEQVRSVGRQLMYKATDLLNLIDQLRYSAGHLSRDWISPRAEHFSQEFERLIRDLHSQAMQLDALGKRVLHEVDEWIEADRVESAYISLKSLLHIDWKELLTLGVALDMASHLRWSPLRPNSMILTGPNWMRELLNIKEATRVIKPPTLSKGMALLGLAESVTEGLYTVVDTAVQMRDQPVSRVISTAITDGAFRFAISAVGNVAIPLAVGALVPLIVGASAPVILTGGAVLVTTVVLQILYNNLVEKPLWHWWQESGLRLEIAENVTRRVNEVSNFLSDLKNQAVSRVESAFQPLIQNLSSSLAPI